jgi:hypothetical protein
MGDFHNPRNPCQIGVYVNWSQARFFHESQQIVTLIETELDKADSIFRKKPRDFRKNGAVSFETILSTRQRENRIVIAHFRHQ